jgi:hypothetical protein
MYSTLDVAYNDNTQELDKMARDLNNKKNNLFKSVYNDFETKQKKWENDIIEYNNSYKKIYENSQSDLESNLDSNYNLDSDKNNSDKNNSDISIDSISIDSPSLDTYIDTIKVKKDKKKPINNFIRNLNHSKKHLNDDDIFSHVKYCFECRDQLLKYMKKHDNIEEDIKNIKNKESIFSYFGTIQTKEIFLIIILGIILIIFLDFLMKTPYSIR